MDQPNVLPPAPPPAKLPSSRGSQPGLHVDHLDIRNDCYHSSTSQESLRVGESPRHPVAAGAKDTVSATDGRHLLRRRKKSSFATGCLRVNKIVS